MVFCHRVYATFSPRVETFCDVKVTFNLLILYIKIQTLTTSEPPTYKKNYNSLYAKHFLVFLERLLNIWHK